MEPHGNSSVALTPAWHSIGACAFPASSWHDGKTSTPQGIPNTDRIDYSQCRAVVVVEGATVATFVTGTITMLIIGVLLNIVGLGIFCWALFALATHALPFFVGMTVGIYSFQVGAGPFGAIVVGFVAGSTTLVAGQFAFSVARSHSPLGRWAAIRASRSTCRL